MSPAAQTKPKKTTSSKKPLSHPPFADMIADAIGSMKERTGSSQYAIAKFIEEKHKELPPTFKKLLLLNLKKSVAAGKLVKVKNSFKLAPTVKASVESKKPKTVAKPNAKAESKEKHPKAAEKKKKAVAKPKAKAVADGDGGKAKKAKSVKSQVKKAPVKSVKKPKSVKSPVKKGAAAKK
ncbi:hypothetical protein RIF29_21898 [Crotalaria pallida]|uniref:H15 domain-containing protein n=1 Tax=Crotalaria pallida TaxID=3830 RepID=A0AAN9F5F2_CROPI